MVFIADYQSRCKYLHRVCSLNRHCIEFDIVLTRDAKWFSSRTINLDANICIEFVVSMLNGFHRGLSISMQKFASSLYVYTAANSIQTYRDAKWFSSQTIKLDANITAFASSLSVNNGTSIPMHLFCIEFANKLHRVCIL